MLMLPFYEPNKINSDTDCKNKKWFSTLFLRAVYHINR